MIYQSSGELWLNEITRTMYGGVPRVRHPAFAKALVAFGAAFGG